MLCEYLHGLFVAGPPALRSRLQAGRWAISPSLHIALATANVLYGVLLTAAYQTPLPSCIILVLKNGILALNLVLGRLLGKHYSLKQVQAVLVVSIGLVLTAVAGQPRRAAQSQGDRRAALAGLAATLGSLVAKGVGNAVQESAMARAVAGEGNAAVAETILFRSIFGLPLLAFQWRLILGHIRRWNQPRLAGVPWPGMWAMLLNMILLNYLMWASVTRLIGRTSALSTNVLLSFQRFLSFILSAKVLNPMLGGTPPMVWFGGAITLSGTVAYGHATAAALEEDHQGLAEEDMAQRRNSRTSSGMNTILSGDTEQESKRDSGAMYAIVVEDVDQDDS